MKWTRSWLIVYDVILLCDYFNMINLSLEICDVCRMLAKLEGADRAFCFTSGMSALATITHLAEAGELCPWKVFDIAKMSGTGMTSRSSNFGINGLVLLKFAIKTLYSYHFVQCEVFGYFLQGKK